MSSPLVLVIEHQPDAPLGWLGEWLVEDGCRLDVRRPASGPAMPRHTAGHDAVLVLGGYPNAHDDVAAPWLPGVRTLMKDALDNRVPLLGICLGHQLLAVTVGGKSVRNPAGQQIGVLDMGWLSEAADDPLLGHVLAPQAVQWNNDVVVDLPDSVQVLARARGGEVQAARFGPAAWGVQCHPEADAVIASGWAEDDRASYTARGLDVDPYVDQVRAAEPELARTWRPLATSFARLAAAQLSGPVPEASPATSS